MTRLREDARRIWQAGVDAVDATRLVSGFLASAEDELWEALERAERILVLGGGKAGEGMVRGVLEALGDRADSIVGSVNVPGTEARHLGSVRLHSGRPPGVNYPTREGVEGVARQYKLLAETGPDDFALCLLSGGGSALLPYPVEGVSLETKQRVTKLLHECGASIDEMNCVRKHLSRFKGGGLARELERRGCPFATLVISDVIGDPLDVIASGPTEVDSTTFADSLAVVERYGLTEELPSPVEEYLSRGVAGEVDETLKEPPKLGKTYVVGNNAIALSESRNCARELGYATVDLGAFWQGETREVARVLAGIARSIVADGQPAGAPACVLSGGETTVTLGENPGKGGRNQELVLAVGLELDKVVMRDYVILSGGTDGEDGPTDSAGAVADAGTFERAAERGLGGEEYLSRHDAYSFFEKTGDLLKTGLTGTNVMDVRVLLVGTPHCQ